MSRDELDMAAVQRDAAVIHSLAMRSVGVRDLDDPVVRALAQWVESVDDGIDDAVAFVMPGSVSSARSVQAGRGRRTMLIAGSTALALVVSGGAAAAVTGDPLAAVKAPLQALAKVNPFSGDETNARDRLPIPAPTKAAANKLLADARRAMAQGHPVKAQRLLAEAKVLLGDDVNPGQQKFIDALTDALPERPGQTGDPGTQPGGGKPDPGTQPGGGTKPDKAPGGKGSASTSTGSQSGLTDGSSSADPDA
ncbi:MAG TPA: hypothetical protein VMX11_02535 [Actinomycetes bacterium]|nr:hypothetical protein [Actinomycetes bacterium]